MTYCLLGRTGDLCSILPFLKAEADAGEKPTLVVSESALRTSERRILRQRRAL